MAPYTYYTWGTPNGLKPQLLLEELGLDYKTESIDISTNKQKEDWFLKINPNGRIPALVDHENKDLAVFESGAIMWYLVMKHDAEGKFWPKDFSERAKVMSWLMFQMGGIGPMQGQANHFIRYAKPQIAYGMNRYRDETKRLYSVLEDQLKQTAYLAGDTYSIADMANYSWVSGSCWAGVDSREFPHVQKWVETISARPATKKCFDVKPGYFQGKFLSSVGEMENALKSANEKIEAAEKLQSS